MTILHDSAAVDRPADQIASLPSPIPWKQFRAEIEAMYQPPAVVKSTRGRMIQVLNEIEKLDLTTDNERADSAEPIRITTTADLTVTLISRFVASRPNGSRYTLQSLLAVVRTICTLAETAGYVRISPFRLRKLSKWVRLPALEGKRHLAREEIRRILDLMARHVEERSGWAQWRSRRLLAVTAIIAYTGVRKNECLRMHVNDVDLISRVLWIRPHGEGEQLKTSAAQAPIPVPEALLPILTGWLAHRMDAPFGFVLPKECVYLIPTVNRKAPWVSGNPGTKALHRFQAVAKLAGIEHATFQDLRRSWATHAEYHKLGPAMIQRVLRHTTTRTSEKHYRQADLDNMNQAVKDFEF